MVKRGLEFKFDLYLFFRMDHTVDHLDSSPRKMECDRVTRQESGSRISRHTPSSNRSMALESSSARSGLTQNALPNLSILPCPRNYPSINHHDKIADKCEKKDSVAPRKFENSLSRKQCSKRGVFLAREAQASLSIGTVFLKISRVARAGKRVTNCYKYMYIIYLRNFPKEF